MSTLKKRKSGGAKTSRSETVAFRLDPKTRHLAEVAARVQRRTLSSYIEWAVEESLKHVLIDAGKIPRSIAEVEADSSLWATSEAHRFALLASRFPQLLTFDEANLWNLVKSVAAISQPSGHLEETLLRGTLNTDLHRYFLQWLDLNWIMFKEAAQKNIPAEQVVEQVNDIEAKKTRIKFILCKTVDDVLERDSPPFTELWKQVANSDNFSHLDAASFFRALIEVTAKLPQEGNTKELKH